MIGKFKQLLGIEGVKLELQVPDEWPRSEKVIRGSVRLYTMHEQTVHYLHVRLVERYGRGRKKDRLVDEYELGTLHLEDQWVIPAGGSIEIPFALPYTLVKSDLDEWGDQNPLFKGLTFLAKKWERVSSRYRLEAQAKVKGTALHPFDKKEIHFTN